VARRQRRMLSFFLLKEDFALNLDAGLLVTQKVAAIHRPFPDKLLCSPFRFRPTYRAGQCTSPEALVCFDFHATSPFWQNESPFPFSADMFASSIIGEHPWYARQSVTHPLQAPKAAVLLDGLQVPLPSLIVLAHHSQVLRCTARNHVSSF
jgi:hypothetical protein